MDIHVLRRQGLSNQRTADRLGISRPTVAKYLNNPEKAFKKPSYKKRASRLDPYVDNIKA